MANEGFNSAVVEFGGVCEEPGCQEQAGLTFSVREKKNLCYGCVLKKNVQNWSCVEHHDKEVELYCRKHSQTICQLCAFTEHHSCKLVDLKKAIAEKKDSLSDLKGTMENVIVSWREHRGEIGECRDFSVAHLTLLRDNIDSMFNVRIKRGEENETGKIKAINEKVEDALRKVNERREVWLRQTRADAERKRRIVRDKQNEVHEELDDITMTTLGKIGRLESAAEDFIRVVDVAEQKISKLLLDDKELVSHGDALISTLSAMVALTPRSDIVGHITQTVTDVRFVEGSESDDLQGLIFGYDSGWEALEPIQLPDFIKKPFIVGSIGSSVIVTDKISHDSYSVDIGNRDVAKIVTGSELKCIISCVKMDENTIVCGKLMRGCSGESLPDGISLYDGQWHPIRDIAIPKNSSGEVTWVFVDVTPDGMILASEGVQRNAYLISPANGHIIRTIRFDKYGWVRGMSSSSDIIVVMKGLLAAVGADGTVRKIFGMKNKYSNIVVDRRKEIIYHLYWDKEHGLCVVDQVLMTSGEVKTKQILSYQLPVLREDIDEAALKRCIIVSRPVLVSSNKMAVCNGRDCLIFRKRISFKHL